MPQLAPAQPDRYSQPRGAGLDSGQIPRELAPCLAVSLAPAHDASATAKHGSAMRVGEWGVGRFVADHGPLEGGRAQACPSAVIDEPGGRVRFPGEGAVAARDKLGQPGAFPAPLERRVREAGPAGGWFGGSYISHNWLRASRGIT